MNTLNNFCRSLLNEVSYVVQSPVLLSENMLVLHLNNHVRNAVSFRCVRERENDPFVWIEMKFMVTVFVHEKLWERYSGRPGVKAPVTCSQQVRHVAYPGYGLPESGFEVSMADSNARSDIVNIMSRVIIEKLIPLANNCQDYAAILKEVQNCTLSAQKFDYAILLAISGDIAGAFRIINEGKQFFSDPLNGFASGGIMHKMFVALESELNSEGKILI
jgi:hypothetical protein